MKAFRFCVGGLLCSHLLCLIAPVSAQTVEMLWSKRKAPWPIPIPSGLDTTKALTDTTKNPYIIVYQATVNPNGAAVVIFPGGGYIYLSSIREGRNVALKFNGYGLTAFVVRNRVGVTAGNAPFQHPIELWDGQRAMRWVRANASRFGVDPHRLGIVGFSAGGHMASMVSTHYDSGNPDSASLGYYPGARDSIDGYSCRPDFQILGYPVINMDSSIAHAGSVTALVGPNASTALKRLLSNEKQITSATPPAFITATLNDGTVPVRNSQNYSDSLQKHGVAHMLLLYPSGTHGFGLADGADGAPSYKTAPNDIYHWPDSALAWMQRSGFLTPATAIRPNNRLTRTAPTAANPGIDLLGRRLSVGARFPFFRLENISNQ